MSFVNISFGLAALLFRYQMSLLKSAASRLKAKGTEKKLRDERMTLLVNFIKDGGDFLGAFNGIFDWGWSDLTNGLLGMNSGTICIISAARAVNH
jgi:hypothetical protein